MQKLVPGAKLSENLVGQNVSRGKYNCNFYLFYLFGIILPHIEYIWNTHRINLESHRKSLHDVT
nr:MAG TPA: hypothetical protein [Caudoviricetes sp.]